MKERFYLVNLIIYLMKKAFLWTTKVKSKYRQIYVYQFI